MSKNRTSTLLFFNGDGMRYRLWVKVKYNSDRSGHDFTLDGHIQRDLAPNEDPTVLIDEMKNIILEEFGGYILEMLEFGLEPLRTEREVHDIEDYKRGQTTVWSHLKKTETHGDFGRLFTKYGTFFYRYDHESRQWRRHYRA